MIINHPHQHQSYEDALTLLCLACHYSHHLFKCFQNLSDVSKQPNESKHRKVTAAGNEMQLGVKLRSFGWWWICLEKKRSGSSDNFSPSGSIWGGRLKVFGRQFDGIKAWHSYLELPWNLTNCLGSSWLAQVRTRRNWFCQKITRKYNQGQTNSAYISCLVGQEKPWIPNIHLHLQT